MPYKRLPRQHAVNKQGQIVRSKNPVSEIIRPSRRSKKTSIIPKILGLIVGVILVYGIIFGVKAFGSLSKIIVKNVGDVSPILGAKINTNALKGEGDGRINILAMGIAGGKHPGADLTDTIMVVSIDPKNKTMAMLSIPRDLLVTLPKPAAGRDKINAVHSYGERNSKLIPGGGPALLKTEVSQILDLTIHYFVRVDFAGFTKLVDTLGGITVNVDKAIDDPFFPADNMIDYKPFKISAGVHNMDGATALSYSRSRETTSDFDRAVRQQKVIQAVKEKSLSIGVLSNPKKMFDIINIIGQHIRTDLQPNELSQLLAIVKDIKGNQVISKVLDNSPDGPLTSYTDGGYYLVPKTGNFKEIQRIAHEIFTDPYLSQEKSNIAIQNGSGKAGMAAQVADQLKTYNYTVSTVVNAPEIVKTTTIYDVTDGQNKVTLELLTKRLAAPVVNVIPANIKKTTPNADIIVVIGEDYSGGKKIIQ